MIAAMVAAAVVVPLEVNHGGSRGSLASAHTGQLKISDPVDVPGYGRPAFLAADPTRPGVWFLDANEQDESIFFWNPNAESLSHYSFSSVNEPLEFGMQAGLTVDSTGTVWAGIDATLLRLDPASGQFTRIAIPSVPTDPSLTGGPGGGPNQPPSLYDTHQVTSLVAEPDGRIAISMSFSDVILFYTPASQTFTTVTLPAGSVPSSMGLLADDSLVVATSNGHSVDVVGEDGSVQQSAVAASAIGCGVGTCVGSADAHHLDVLSAQGSANPSPGASTMPTSISGSLAITPATASSVQLKIGQPATPLTGGRILGPTTSGFAVVDPSTGMVQSYALPEEECSTAGMSNPSGSAPSSVPCQESPEQYVVDSAGDVWFTSNFGTSDIYEMSAGTY